MSFPGTMTLSPETFQAVVLEVVESLRQHGVERFFIIDGHAGNQGALDVLMTKGDGFRWGFAQPTYSTSPSWTTSCAKVHRQSAGDTPARWKRRWG